MIESISQKDIAFPPLLKEIQNPPSLLYMLGSPIQWNRTIVSIVGTRKATREGLMQARMFARELAHRGCIIVSGLALGIDAAAHEGALEARGTTVAVLANGLDSIYPRQHERLAKQIIESDGCVFSEYPEKTPPYPSQFLERNRIVAGISHATLVIEAPIRSGSIATARIAIESGRDVFVVPGPITNKNYEGSHTLLRNGARLVSKPEDIFEDLNIEIIKQKEIFSALGDTTSQRIIETLRTSSKPLQVDTIIEIAHLEPHKVQEALTILALDGIINDLGGVFTLNE